MVKFREFTSGVFIVGLPNESLKKKKDDSKNIYKGFF